MLTQTVDGSLNPNWVEWLMGWPIGWTSLEPVDRKAIDKWIKTVSQAWWRTDPADLEEMQRVTKITTNRTARLKALGNGQCPVVAAEAWNMLARGGSDGLLTQGI